MGNFVTYQDYRKDEHMKRYEVNTEKGKSIRYLKPDVINIWFDEDFRLDLAEYYLNLGVSEKTKKELLFYLIYLRKKYKVPFEHFNEQVLEQEGYFVYDEKNGFMRVLNAKNKRFEEYTENVLPLADEFDIMRGKKSNSVFIDDLSDIQKDIMKNYKVNKK